MNWQPIKDWIDPFLWGAFVGYLWFPTWALAKKIWAEAKKAKQEWNKPNGNSD